MFKHSLFVIAIFLLAACAPSPTQLTSTANADIAQTETAAPTNTLAPTQTETPEPTATQTATPSPTVTVTPTLPPFPTWEEIKAEYWEKCQPLPVDPNSIDEMNWIGSQLAGKEVVYFLEGPRKGPQYDHLLAIGRRSDTTCLLVAYSESPIFSREEGQHRYLDAEWGTWEVPVIVGYYNGTEVVKYYYFPSENSTPTPSP
jgi:hypothetical protein